jgi:hypothetical protein
MDTAISEEEAKRLLQLLKRRQLKTKAIALLTDIKERKDLKRGQVSTDKNATYEIIIESIKKSLNEGWLQPGEFTQLLDNAELAGRQHVCLFEVSSDLLEAVRTSLLNPATLNDEPIALEEFWEIPLEAYTRVLSSSGTSLLILKIVTHRSYWIRTREAVSANENIVHEKCDKERAAVIVKLDAEQRLLQFRVPISENTQNIDTARAIYEFIKGAVASQFGDEGLAWFVKLPHWPVGSAFENIVNNRDDFELYTDTPENNKFKASISKKGYPEDGVDVRSLAEWNFANGYARTSIRGSWKMADSSVDVRMHADRVPVGDQTVRQLARFFFPKPCNDNEVEHVISRVWQHLPTRSSDPQVAASGASGPRETSQ